MYMSDPKPGDLSMSRLKSHESVMEGRTRISCNWLGGLVDRGKMPIEPGDSWLSPKGLWGPWLTKNTRKVEHWMGY